MVRRSSVREFIRSAIQRDPVLQSLFELARKKGDRIYLVGGTLRDLALGRPPGDWDLVADRPWEFATAAANALGKRVISLGKEALPTYRIALPSCHLDVVGLDGAGLEADLRRRDFTVDALAYDPEDDWLLDPTGGIEDLENKLLRVPSPGAFLQDPLRIVKAFRLLAQMECFRLESGTRALLEAAREALADVAPERLCHELELLLAAPAPSAAVREMAQTGILEILLPELKPLRGLTQNRFHHADVLDHTLLALQELDGPPPWMGPFGLSKGEKVDWVTLRLSALLHDAGKAATYTVDAKGEAHFHGHPKPSAELARQALKRLRFSGERTEAVATLCLNHLRPLGLLKTQPRKTALRRLVHDLGPALNHLLLLAVADKRASKGQDHLANLEALKGLCGEALAVARDSGEELRRLPKLVDGLEALEILGLNRPGPELGKALDALHEQQVSGDISHRDAAIAFLCQWAKQHSSP